MTGIVLKIVTYGFITHETFWLRPDSIPRMIPNTVDKTIDMINLKIDAKMIPKESKFVNMLNNDKKTACGDGIING